MKQAQHLDAEVEDLALGRPRVRPRALAPLAVEVEAVVLLIGVLGPLRDLAMHVRLHLLHLHLQLVQLASPLLWGEVGVAEVDNGLVRLPVGVLQRVRPRAHTGGGVVIEDAVVAVKVLGPVRRQGGLQGLDGDPQKVVVSHRVNAEVSRVGDQLRTGRLQALPLLVLRLADEVVYGKAGLSSSRHARTCPLRAARCTRADAVCVFWLLLLVLPEAAQVVAQPVGPGGG
mmetsp:Transcript_93489/g.241612  ORF Transcript_93489/g.241612 Transcript_93489/m.241612 type:complete len:229 (+) Transcript_93489:789-1475(+)